MTGKILLPLAGLLVAASLQAQTVPPASGGYPIDPVPFTSVKVAPDSFWGQRLRLPARSPSPWLSPSAKAKAATRISSRRKSRCTLR